VREEFGYLIASEPPPLQLTVVPPARSSREG
jgi:hypothetical protein